MERFKLVVAVYVLFRREDKILMLRRFNTGWEDGNYSMVAGHIDGDEPLAEAAAREALEEAGVKVDRKDLVLRTVMHRRSNDERIEFLFEAMTWEGEPRNMEPGKCDDLSWYPITSLPPNTIPHVRKAIENALAGVPYSDLFESK